MSLAKKLVWGVLFILIGIQFIRPAHNTSAQHSSTDISSLYSMPENVEAVLKSACYDCHSNNTNYPWYSNVQPLGWLLAKHIDHGKEELNFNEFGSYTLRRQKSKLKSVASQVKDGEMPLKSYTLAHKKARLTKDQKELIIHWALQTKDSLEQIKP